MEMIFRREKDFDNGKCGLNVIKYFIRIWKVFLTEKENGNCTK